MRPGREALAWEQTRSGLFAFQGSHLASPLHSETPRHRSGAERLAEQLGGEDKLRRFLAGLANALEMGATTRIEFESRPGSGQVMQHRLLHGGPLW